MKEIEELFKIGHWDIFTGGFALLLVLGDFLGWTDEPKLIIFCSGAILGSFIPKLLFWVEKGRNGKSSK